VKSGDRVRWMGDGPDGPIGILRHVQSVDMGGNHIWIIDFEGDPHAHSRKEFELEYAEVALIVKVLVNDSEIGTLECVRAGRYYSHDPDAVHKYHVRIDDEEMGTVEHRYGDNKWVLIEKALMLRTETTN